MAKKVNQKNKRKWLHYILELLVVFVGVTAGFLLNTWREEQANIKLEQKYLESFYADLLIDQKNLDTLIINSRQKSDNLIEIVKLTEAIDKPLTEQQANKIVKEIIYIEWFSSSDDTYKDILNSGNLNIISDFKLKEMISSYYSLVDEVKNVEEYFNKHMNNYGFPFILNNYHVLKGKFKNNECYHSLEFTNMYLGTISFFQQNNDIYQRTLNLNLNIQEKIHNKISSK